MKEVVIENKKNKYCILQSRMQKRKKNRMRLSSTMKNQIGKKCTVGLSLRYENFLEMKKVAQIIVFSFWNPAASLTF